jgi:hypothetical protein
MKEEILKRDMFAMPLSSKSKNTGIMQGFEDMEDTSVEEMPPMARVPQNPEILMNNLRGDIRSVDARYMELAQMVGEQAAMDTPPEVLAMLQMQMAQPPSPPAGVPPEQPPQMGMPPDMGMQGGIGALPQAAGMMPPGMEGAPPFPVGANGAPPTPDGLPPERAALGKFISGAARYGSDIAEGARTMGRNVYEAGSDAVRAADRFLGDTFARPYMDIGPMTRDGRRLVGQGQDDLRMYQPDPYTAQTPMPGEGTQLRGLNTINLRTPTMTQAIEAAGRINPKSFVGGAVAATLPYSLQLGKDIGDRLSRTADKRSGAESQVNLIPGEGPPLTDPTGKPLLAGQAMMPGNETINKIVREPSAISTAPVMPMEKKPEESVIQEKPVVVEDVTNKFIKEKLAEPKTKVQRIKEEYAGLEPMFTEILGKDKDSMRMNALLLLSDAGFKLASTYKPTAAMAIGEALSGLPKGMAVLAAQARQNGIQLKTAALQQAVGNIELQDKYAFEMQKANINNQAKRQLKILDNDYNLMLKQIEAGQFVEGKPVVGLQTVTSKSGSFKGYKMDPNDPTFKSAIESDNKLRPTDNYFITYTGRSPATMVTDDNKRVKLQDQLGNYDSTIRSMNALQDVISGAYGIGSFFSDIKNNLFVPIAPNAIVSPDLDQAGTVAKIKSLLSTIQKDIAQGDGNGKVAVQTEKWAQDVTKRLNDPTAFFSDPELAAKELAALRTGVLNGREEVVQRLGFEGNNYIMSVPNIGTRNDPFVLPNTLEDRSRMLNYLAGVYKTAPPNAQVHLKKGPSGEIIIVTPQQILSAQAEVLNELKAAKATGK